MKNTNENTPASEVPWPHPSVFDLEAWVAENKPEVYTATRYLYSVYDIYLSVWHDAGRPTEGFEDTLFTIEDALG
jgi:hypothetical protein